MGNSISLEREVSWMNKIRTVCRVCIIFCLLMVNMVPFINFPNLGESGAPPDFGKTNTTWYISKVDDVKRNDTNFWTKDIIINSSGRMNWLNINAFIDGDIEVKSNAYFNLTNCYLNLSGNFIIKGIVNFDNVTLVMNSSFDGEFGIDVTSIGKFNIMNNSNITAMNTTAPIDLFTSISGYESWGLHYNFTVSGKLKINNSNISYTYGDDDFIGGIHLLTNLKAIITNSTIYKNEITAIYAEGKTKHLIQNNHIYNSSLYGIYLTDYARPIVDNNIIETGLDNYGIGIICLEHCHAKISMNTIQNNYYDGIYLYNCSNATILKNKIQNNQRAGILVFSRIFAIQTGPPYTKYYKISYPTIKNNIITNNFEWGIFDICSPMEVINNTISHTKNQSGIFVWNPYYLTTTPATPVGLNIPGNITDNLIQYNNHYGINLSSLESANYRGVITMVIKQNTITNNNWSGINVEGGTDNQNIQRSPNPNIAFNNISFNNEHGINNEFALRYSLRENRIEWNNDSGILLDLQSRPNIYNNNISWNQQYGISTLSSSQPKVYLNNITYNFGIGIRLSGNDNSEVYNNFISNNLEHGIEVRSSTPDIHDNHISFNNYSGIYGRSGGGNFKIRLNEIDNNSWSGIECNLSSCNIQDNYIHHNNKNGMTFQQNSQPVLNNNLINYNSLNGIYLHASSPQRGTVGNDITNNSEHGIASEGGSGGIIWADILNNAHAGVHTSGSGTNTVILNSIVSSNGEHGINATDNSAPEIINSTISNDNTGYAFWSTSSADPIALNTTFNHAKTYFDDTASVLTVNWYVHVRTVSEATGDPVGNTRVWINSTTQASANPLWSGIANSNGELNWLRITDYTEKKSGVTNYQPVDVTGDADYYRTTHISPNPAIHKSQTLIIELLPNNPPTKATNILPKFTHNSHPTIKWDPATDPDEGHLVKYKVWIGTTQNTSLPEYESSSLTVTSYTLTKDLEHDKNDGNKTYHITVVSTDGHGGKSYSFQTLNLLNHKPTTPDISLDVPKNPTVLLKSVTCQIINLSVDPDGDQINYTYKWFKNGNEVPGLTNSDTQDISDTISYSNDAITFEKGDTWRVRVYANDGIGFKNMVYQNMEFTIGNVGPTVKQKLSDIVMNEDEKRLGDIDLTKMFEDIDEEKDLTYKIKVTDNHLKVTENKITHKVDIIPDLNWNGEAEVTFTCYDTEGLWAEQNIKITVNPVNDKPEFKFIGGIPWRPGTAISFQDDLAAKEDKWFNITIIGSDADIERGENDALLYQVSDPEKISITHLDSDPLNATLSFLPTNEDVGKFVFTISVKDKETNYYIHETTIEVTVINTNDKPFFYSLKRSMGNEIFVFPEDNVLDLRNKIKLKQNDILTLLITAIDPDLDNDDDILSFHTDIIDILELSTLPTDPATARIIISPRHDSIGTLSFNITVKDSALASDSVRIILSIENENDRPQCWIVIPGITNKEYYQDSEITLEGDANDYDLPYGDSLTFTWSSNVDGDLGIGKIIKVSNLTLGKHLITFIVEDSKGASNSNFTTIIILEPEKVPGGEDDDTGKDSDILFFASLAIMIIVILVMLLVLFLALRARRKREKEEEKKAFSLSRPGEKRPPTPGELKATGAPGVVKPPSQYVPPFQGIPQELPEITSRPTQPTPQVEPQLQPQQAPQQQMQQPPQFAQQPFIPPQLTSCPKCNSFMTFAPDGTMYCLTCGYSAGQL